MTGVILNFCATVDCFVCYFPKPEGLLAAKLLPSHRLFPEQTIFSSP